MFRNLTIALLFGASMISVSAQSGRRIETKPTPQPQASVPDETPQYSESKAQAPRRTRPAIGFPKMAQDATAKPKTDQPGEAVGDDDIVKVETNLVTIPVSVFDRNGLYIPGLRQEDFKIFENGKEQDIAYFGSTDKPFTATLLIDTSPSTAYKIEEIHQAAIAFVDQLMPQDRVMVIEFDGRVNVRTEPTNDREAIYRAIRKTNFGDGTSLYDAVDFTLVKKLNRIAGRKVIVLFTDGVDTTSRHSTYESSIDMAEESDSLIFPIYFNTFFDNDGGGGIPNINGGGLGGSILRQRGTSSADYQRGRAYLNDLAAYTGGRVFRPEATPGGLSRAFEGIAEEMRRQYSIGYVPREEGKPGQRKDIKVRVNRPNMIVRSRDSYIVGATVAAPDQPAKPKN